VKHEKLTAGRPPEINPAETYEYARDVERALRKLPKRVLDKILDARSPEELAEAISSLPHRHTATRANSRRALTECARCMLLGGWEHRNKIWPRLVAPTGDKPARTLSTKIENRTLPELLFLAITELGATSEDLERIADSVAAPALYDNVCTPAEIEHGNRALTKTDRKLSLVHSRKICSKERRRRAAKQ
jgi:hypothetical protein